MKKKYHMRVLLTLSLLCVLGARNCTGMPLMGGAKGKKATEPDRKKLTKLLIETDDKKVLTLLQPQKYKLIYFSYQLVNG